MHIGEKVEKIEERLDSIFNIINELIDENKRLREALVKLYKYRVKREKYFKQRNKHSNNIK